MSTLNFNFVFLGQSVLRYQVPLDVYNTINHIYETKYLELKPANKQLVGKIEKEHSLFFDGPDNNKMTRNTKKNTGFFSRMVSNKIFGLESEFI